MNIEKTFQGNGGYVFVSHSHLDIERVRKIRNYLEEAGMEPILFYLRCMDSDDDEKIASLKELIFNEIDSREFFLYVDSKNASSSEWVQDELTYIRSKHPDRITSVNIDDSFDITEKFLCRMIRGMRIFICASSFDKFITNRLAEELKKQDFRVYDVNDDIQSCEVYSESVRHTITELSKEGFVIALISDASASSRFFVDELETAISNNVPVLPIVIKSFDTFSVTLAKIHQQIPKLQDINALFISENPTDTEISDVVRSAVRIKEELEYYDRQKNDLPRFFLD